MRPFIVSRVACARAYTVSSLDATSSQLYISRTRAWIAAGESSLFFSERSVRGSAAIASLSAATNASGSGSARNSRSGGSTSGTPPTPVATTRHPQHAASSMAMQKLSVSEQLRNTCARRSTSTTRSCGTFPRSVTLDVSPCFWVMRSKCGRMGPSPATRKSTSGKAAHAAGITPASKCTPLRYARRAVTATTTLPFSDRRIELSGVNLAASTALGTTETRRGGAPLRSTVFSFAVCDTHTTWLQSLSVSTKSLFMWIALVSLNPNSEWSVNTHLYPMVRA
mmetsp:Transcript_1230/g.4943  ORF Transcript_1230/g.4943 Transcript_1230/m.4943 type:complete len:281 (+) Transcript_1230:237-1079(+)